MEGVWVQSLAGQLRSHMQNIKQKQYCNKFSKGFESGPHQKKKKKKILKKNQEWHLSITLQKPIAFLPAFPFSEPIDQRIVIIIFTGKGHILLIRVWVVNEIELNTSTCSLCFLPHHLNLQLPPLIFISKNSEGEEWEEKATHQRKQSRALESPSSTQSAMQTTNLPNKCTQACPLPHGSPAPKETRRYVKVFHIGGKKRNKSCFKTLLGAAGDPQMSDLQSPHPQPNQETSTQIPSLSAKCIMGTEHTGKVKILDRPSDLKWRKAIGSETCPSPPLLFGVPSWRK